MMKTLMHIWQTKDLRNKILITLGFLAAYRMIAHIPVPGVNLAEVQSIMAANEAIGIFSALTGGTMENFSIMLMGLSPYINASIIIQLMTVVFPQLEELSNEGEEGRKKLNKYTRWLTVPLAFIQSYGMILLLSSSSSTQIIDTSSLSAMLPIMITVTAGTILAMYIGELISEKGIGNGTSIIIFAGIISAIPGVFVDAFSFGGIASANTEAFIGYIVITLALLVIITLFTEAYRNISVTYASRGSRAQKTTLPLRLNQSGMIPIIFAISMITFPTIIAQLLVVSSNATLQNIGTWINTYLQSSNPSMIYIAAYFVLVWAFAFFYVSIVFKPDQIAESIQKRGGYIEGLRPGNETASFLQSTSVRLTFWGGLFLSLVAIAPLVYSVLTGLNQSSMVLTGSGLIIIVGVVLELIRQINTHLEQHNYDRI